MDFLAQYGLFALKAITLVIFFLLAVVAMFALGRNPRPKLEITSLNKDFATLKQRMAQEIKNEKIKKVKQSKEEQKNKPSLYLIDFHGDTKASQVEQLREMISAILSIAKENDEVILRLDSPGGVVTGYGLAASQLQRLRDHKIPLTVCIDKIAASGGYLMACVANRILAAPFAIIGSIGVVGQLPNFHRWLKKNNIDFELITAGEYKRTLTIFGENTEKGREKFQEDVEEIHQAFKAYVLTYRDQVDIDKVSTGEHWLATDALDLNLIDALKTSDDYIMEKMDQFNSFHLTMHTKKSLIEKLVKPVMSLFHPWA